MRDNYSQATLIQKAVHSRSIPLIWHLLLKGAQPNVKGAYGYTALHECCYMGSAKVGDIFLRRTDHWTLGGII